jgi:hypothetical protein
MAQSNTYHLLVLKYQNNITMNKIIKFALIAITCFNFFSCNESSKKIDQKNATQDIEKTDSTFTCFNININKSDTIVINDSVKFFYSNKTFLINNKEKGETQIRLRCIYKATDAYLLDIPLMYDSSNVLKFLKTRGMYEIKLEEDVKINDKFPAQLILNKKNIKDEFRLYTFDEKNRKWNYTSTLPFLNDNNLNPLNLIPLQLNKSMVKVQINLKDYIQGSLLSNIPDVEWVYAGPEGDEQMDPSINDDFATSKITDFEVTPSTYKKGCLDLVLSTNENTKLKTIVAAAFDKSNFDKANSLVKDYYSKKNVIIEFNGPGLVNIDQCISEISSKIIKRPEDFKHLFVSFKLAKDNRIILEEVHKINFFNADNSAYFKLGNIPSAIYSFKNDSSISIPKTLSNEFNVILCVDEMNNKWIKSSVNFNKIFEMNQLGRSPLITLQKKEEHEWVNALSNQ